MGPMAARRRSCRSFSALRWSPTRWTRRKGSRPMAEMEEVWRDFEARARADGARPIATLFDAEPDRLHRLSFDAAGLHLDLSKHAWSAAGFEAALALADACRVEATRAALFAGKVVNASEDRAALHIALRAPDGADYRAKGEPVSASLGEGSNAHLIAVTANAEAARASGILEDRIFAFSDWVGGRYSIWSAVGLACAIGLGWEAFAALLAGAAEMDEHFRTAPLSRNTPVALALAHVFNRNGLARPSRAVIPYVRRLSLLPAYLQQLEMESNGKRVTAQGQPAAHATASVVFGEPGTNAQHAFFQLLHQGTDVVPVDIVAVSRSDEGPAGFQSKLLANAVAQAEALMVGRPESEVRHELAAKGLPAHDVETLAPQRAFPGDRPSSFILLPRLTPHALGALLALYEHKTFVEGVLWGIDSFDQWGVELGKTLAGRVLAELEGGPPATHDPSTAALIARLKV